VLWLAKPLILLGYALALGCWGSAEGNKSLMFPSRSLSAVWSRPGAHIIPFISHSPSKKAAGIMVGYGSAISLFYFFFFFQINLSLKQLRHPITIQFFP
jgi:hypothetical protein